MLAELVDHVIGVDPDRDWITAAVVDANTTGVVATQKFPADSAGYDDALAWAESLTVTGERAWAIEGTASYGRGLTAALGRAGEWVIEFDRPREKASKDGAKTDELDAIRAAREALGRARLHSPRAHDGHREALRVHTVTRAGVIRVRTAAINELKALVLTAPDVDAVLSTGGTGITGRDGTPEAVEPLLDKVIDGFGELFRALSFEQIGTSSLQSRALAGVANATFVFVLPGSGGACRLAWEKLIGQQLDNRTRPCNLVMLMPRLNES